ncbi:MAG: NADH-ubiquinone oxidoreductase chain G [Cytophagales bacterium]|jgi:NADH-quinone oxidoreductase subunit G|nr:NADH-quinone oxidoreductase subunit NuoG [Bacteroidota bacterium]MBS1980853.1 NADH-quinone oxidoreductase subunit NuoG [Bacteroidota bacterium]WHZ08200.1 MAG: NADH-ubiquinone oxidoreductase chain G [Cytophagales bacterium]
MATLYIDNQPYEVTSGNNLLETCLTLGFDLPYFCWHPAMGSVGACRQCAIKVYKDENDKKGKLVMSCMEPVTNNQRISITDAEAKEFREEIIGWLMTNHPHDCAVCDEGGSCHLQDMTVMTGHSYRKFRYKKRTHINQNLGPFINHEMNRCIQCYRCVRFYNDYAGGKDFDVFASRNNVYFGRHEDGVLENEFSGNLSEVCPTGVFTDKTLKQHYTRKWDLTMAPSVCQHCSLGCNTIAGERYGSLRMIANRYHGEVNGYFICDRGRFGYEFVNAPDRVRQPVLNGKTVGRDEIMEEIKKRLKESKVIGIGSPRASIQSNFALKALVGKNNFYHGVSENEHDMAELAIQILKEGPARTPSLKEVESADAIFIMGEDLTNSSPMLALAVRQAVRVKPMKEVIQANIPDWHDYAAREFVQEKKGPLYSATIHGTKLDDIAAQTHYAAPDEIARLGFAVAHRIDSSVPDVENYPDELKKLADTIAEGLKKAERPVVISGLSSESESVMKAAANVAWALNKSNKNTGLVLTMLECNSLGLAMMGGGKLDGAFNAILHSHADTAIIMENDLYRHGSTATVDKFLKMCRQIIVLDHTPNPTMSKAHVIIPAGTFAESDGTLVNNEGRAQRFFQVYEATDVIQESWRWLLNMGVNAGNERMSHWKNFEDITKAISDEEPMLKGVETITPPATYRVAGQRIPREPHRYSGRTAMNAHLNVSEPKPPEDPDSSLSYTMEGYRGLAPSSMIPYFWSPGWNSVQSVNKYQQEVAGHLRGGDPGLRLIEANKNTEPNYFMSVPEFFQPIAGHFWVVWTHHIYGSDELSNKSASVSQRVPKPYVMINPKDAEELKLTEGQLLSFEVLKDVYELPVRINNTIPAGLAAMPYALEGMPATGLPEWGIIKSVDRK